MYWFWPFRFFLSTLKICKLCSRPFRSAVSSERFPLHGWSLLGHKNLFCEYLPVLKKEIEIDQFLGISRSVWHVTCLYDCSDAILKFSPRSRISFRRAPTRKPVMLKSCGDMREVCTLAWMHVLTFNFWISSVLPWKHVELCLKKMLQSSRHRQFLVPWFDWFFRLRFFRTSYIVGYRLFSTLAVYHSRDNMCSPF